MRSDGSSVTQLTHFPAEGVRATQPTWTPNGDQIMFTRVAGVHDDARTIATIRADGTDLQDLGIPGTHNRLRPTT